MLNKLAQGTIDLTPQGEFASVATWSIGQIVSVAITLILVVAALVFLFMLLIGGVKWITSGGDKAQTESARNQITAALIGLVIVFAAWAIIQIVDDVFGINILQLDLPTI